jgi:hypothetical protein
MKSHLEQLDDLGFMYSQEALHIHISLETTGRATQVALYSCWADGNFNGWGWHETLNGRQDVHRWSEMIRGLKQIHLRQAHR